MTEIKPEINEAAAVKWLTEAASPDSHLSDFSAACINAARAALRWLEERDEAMDLLNGVNDDAPDTLAVYLFRNWTTPARERLKRRLMLPTEQEAQARIAELEQSARAYEHYVMTGRNEQHECLVAERDRLKERIAELEAERDAALKRAEELAQRHCSYCFGVGEILVRCDGIATATVPCPACKEARHE